MGFVGFLNFMASCLKPYWKQSVLIGLGLVLELAFGSLVPFTFKYIVDDALIGRNGQVLVSILVGLGVGAVVVSISGLVRDYLYALVCTRVLRDLRERLFNHLQGLSLDFYARTKVGDVLTRFTGDQGVVEQAMGAAIPWGLLPALDVLASTALLFVIDWRLALVAMLILPMCLLGPRIFAPRATGASHNRRQFEAGSTANLQGQLMSQPAIKAFSLEARAQSFCRAQHPAGRLLPALEFFQRPGGALGGHRHHPPAGGDHGGGQHGLCGPVERRFTGRLPDPFHQPQFFPLLRHPVCSHPGPGPGRDAAHRGVAGRSTQGAGQPPGSPPAKAAGADQHPRVELQLQRHTAQSRRGGSGHRERAVGGLCRRKRLGQEHPSQPDAPLL